MAETRTAYTAGFRLQAVRQVFAQHLAVAEVDRRLGSPEGRRHDRLEAFRAQGADASPATGGLFGTTCHPTDSAPIGVKVEEKVDSTGTGFAVESFGSRSLLRESKGTRGLFVERRETGRPTTLGHVLTTSHVVVESGFTYAPDQPTTIRRSR